MGHIAFTPQLDFKSPAVAIPDLRSNYGADSKLSGKRLMIDGHNLSLEKGTGVATYAGI